MQGEEPDIAFLQIRHHGPASGCVGMAIGPTRGIDEFAQERHCNDLVQTMRGVQHEPSPTRNETSSSNTCPSGSS